MSKPVVGILMGSESDFPVMEGAANVFKEFGVPFEIRVLSAHRTPDEAADYAKTARDRGLKVIVAAAGGAAHLGGVLAAFTTLPVLGVPISSKDLKGMDSLLSMVQMPSGIPVATLAINGSKNAALFAIAILSTHDQSMEDKLSKYRENMLEKVAKMNSNVNEKTFGTQLA